MSKTPGIVNIHKTFLQREGELPENPAEYIGAELQKLGIGTRYARKTELLSEETVEMFFEHAKESAPLKVKISRFFGDVSVSLSMPGEEFDPTGETDGIDEDPDLIVSENAIRSILIRSHGEKYRYRNKGGVNYARILTGQDEQRSRNYTMIALLAGLLFGLFARFVLPAGVTQFLCAYLMEPIKTMFMNALNIIIAPVVFFSIVTCFSQFDSIKDFGKLGAKVLGMYLFTTVIAVGLGIGMFLLLRPGTFGFAASMDLSSGIDLDIPAGETSLLQTIISIVPSNFLRPFMESNTLQIIFLAVLCGIAVGSIGSGTKMLRDAFEALNALFLKLTSMIAKCIPFAAFASLTIMVVTLDMDSFLSVAAGAGVTILCYFVMMGIYGLLILTLGRLNPILFFKKAQEGMLTSFTLCSSNAAMPTNVRVATEKLGIAPRLANFSIPLGATINMDGYCILLSVMGLFLARAFGVEVSAASLVSLALMVILLSLGTPGVPGSGLVCLGIVLRTIHAPVEAIGLIIALNTILDMFDTANNTTGDLAAAVIVANSEKLLDKEIYYGK